MKYSSEILWYLFWVVSIVGSYYATLYGIKRFEKKWNVQEQESKTPIEE